MSSSKDLTAASRSEADSRRGRDPREAASLPGASLRRGLKAQDEEVDGGEREREDDEATDCESVQPQRGTA